MIFCTMGALGGSRSQAILVTLAYFFWEHKFLIADILDTSCRIATKFCMVRGLANGYFFSEYGELSFWGPAMPYGDTHQSVTDVLVVAARNVESYIVYCMFLWIFLRVMSATKSTNFGSRYLSDGSSEKDGILQVARGGLMYLTTQTGDLWPRGSPWRVKILKGVKKFETLYSKVVSLSR